MAQLAVPNAKSSLRVSLDRKSKSRLEILDKSIPCHPLCGIGSSIVVSLCRLPSIAKSSRMLSRYSSYNAHRVIVEQQSLQQKEGTYKQFFRLYFVQHQDFFCDVFYHALPFARLNHGNGQDEQQRIQDYQTPCSIIG